MGESLTNYCFLDKLLDKLLDKHLTLR